LLLIFLEVTTFKGGIRSSWVPCKVKLFFVGKLSVSFMHCCLFKSALLFASWHWLIISAVSLFQKVALSETQNAWTIFYLCILQPMFCCAELCQEEHQEVTGDGPENNPQYTTVYVGNLAHEVRTILTVG
jgi:hypothetical protein